MHHDSGVITGTTSSRLKFKSCTSDQSSIKKLSGFGKGPLVNHKEILQAIVSSSSTILKPCHIVSDFPILVQVVQ